MEIFGKVLHKDCETTYRNISPPGVYCFNLPVSYSDGRAVEEFSSGGRSIGVG